MSYNPTLVSASLSDDELQKSINSLVNKFKEATDKMRGYMDSTVKDIKTQLQSLGNVNINIGTTSDGGSTRRVKQEQAVAQAIKETTAAKKEQKVVFDNVAAAQDKALNVKSARDSYYAMFEGMREQANHLKQLITSWENLLLQRKIGEFEQVGAQITATTQKINALKAEITQLRQTQPTGYRSGIKEKEAEIDRLKTKIDELKVKQQEIANAPIQDNAYLAETRRKYQEIQNTLNSEFDTQTKITREIAKQTSEQDNYTRKIQRQAEIIRQRLKESGSGVTAWGNAVIYDPNDARNAKMKQAQLSIEEQLTRAHQEQIQLTERRIQQEEKLRERKQETITVAQQQVQAEQQAAQAGQQTKKPQPKTFASYEDLRQAMAHVLGLQVQEIKLADAETASYNKLNTTLKQLQSAYNQLTKSERNSENGKVLAASIREVEQALKGIKQQAAKPANIGEILGTSPRTLAEISDKMRQLQAYKQGIDFTKKGADKEIQQVDEALVKLQKDMDKYMAKGKDVLDRNNALARSWNYMKNRLAFYFTVGASTQFIKNLMDIRSQYEMNERALGILINSAERGTQVFQELSQMALVSPYTLIELSSAAKQLTAYDIAAKDVVDTTRRLADMASAVGVPIERLTYALGQIKAYGYLNSRDARMFANAGIPLVKQLSDYYTKLEGKVVSVGDVYDKMKKKAIDYNSVMAVVTKMTDEGGKFFDFQAKMAGTLKVQLANLTLAWNNMLNDIGASRQGLLTGAIKTLKDIFLHWKEINAIISNLLWSFGLLKAGQFISLMVFKQQSAQMAATAVIGKRLTGVFVGLNGSMKALASNALTWWFALIAVGVNLFQTWSRNTEEIHRLNQAIADGAKEAADSLGKFIESSEIASARLSALTGKLPKAEAEKTWEALREQIELSAISAQDLIPQLVATEDLNERLTKAFDLATRIKEADEKLSDLFDSLDVSQNTVLGGILGEGLEEDIDDYNQMLAQTAEDLDYLTKKNVGFWEEGAHHIKGIFMDVKESLGNSTQEAQNEIENFAHNAAETIRYELGDEGIKDAVQVNEAIARIIKGIEQQYPKINGKGKVLFETLFNDVMAKEFNGAVDKQAYYYKLFLERLKKDHGSAFQGVTDGILSETHRWSSGQIDAINKTADRVKTELPAAAQTAIDEILDNLNNTDFKLRIVAQFATDSTDALEKAMREKFISKPWIADTKERERAEAEAAQKYGTLLRKNGETDLDYQNRIKEEKKKQLETVQAEQAIINKNANKQDDVAKAATAAAKESLASAKNWLSAADDIENVGGFDFTTKGETSAATKAQKQAETELQKALKQELQLIDKVRSAYKGLTSEGVSHIDAINAATSGFDKSVGNINSVLGKYGLSLDLTKFAGISNPRQFVEMLTAQVNALVGRAKPAEIQELQVKIQELGLDVIKFDQKTITDSLNNELGKLKEDYELAVVLDANPEMGNMFADMMGINTDTLPHTVEEYAKEYTKLLNTYLQGKRANLTLPHLELTDDDLRSLEQMTKDGRLNKQVYKSIADAVVDVRNKRKKEYEETIKGWDKLIEKYSEYEAKISAIQKSANAERIAFIKQFGNAENKSQAVRLNEQIQISKDPDEKQRLVNELKELVQEVAGDDSAKLKIVTTIDTREQRDTARVAFEEFQKDPAWIAATGDLAGLTNRAIGGLIDTLEKYKKSAKNLDPKQIKTLNNALKALYKQQRQGNPFQAFANAVDEARERAASYQETIDETQAHIDALNKKKKENGELNNEEGKQLEILTEKLKRLKQEQKNIGKISATSMVSAINDIIGVANTAIEMFNKMADVFRGKNWSEAQETLNDVFSTIQGAGQGAAAGAQIGGGWGAVIGGVLGGVTSALSAFSDNADKRIDNSIKKSELAVKRLQVAFVDLEKAADAAYGSGVVGAKKAVAAAKELQLAEMERQLRLEESRDSKHRDDEKIADLRRQIKELRYEIKETITEITNDLLGSDVGSFAENLVSSMIDAFKQGEDYMQVFEDKFDEMVDNMIMKSIVSRVVTQYLDVLWNNMDEKINQRSQAEQEALKQAQANLAEIEGMSAKEWAGKYGKQVLDENTLNSYFSMFNTDFTTQKVQDAYDAQLQAAKAAEKAAQDALTAAGVMQDSDITALMEELAAFKPELGEKIKELLGMYYRYGQESDKELSALQQGIQGITEDTAGALEAYMNGVSQQVYLHSDLLTQIRDAVVGYDLDVQVATMSQLLLQLRSSYEVQQSIQSILSGWSSPNGLAVRVELNS